MFSVIPSSKDNEKILSSKTDLPEEIYFLCPYIYFLCDGITLKKSFWIYVYIYIIYISTIYIYTIYIYTYVYI